MGGAGQHRQHILAFDVFHGDFQISAEGYAFQFEGLEIRTAGQDALLIQVEPGTGKQLRCGIAMQPALEGDGRGRTLGAHDRIVLAGSGGGHAPAVCGGLVFVNHQCREGAAPFGLLEFVHPAPVIGHALIAEKASHGLVRQGCEIRIIDQEHSNFAGQIDITIVIPLALWGAGAEADKHHGCAFNNDLLPGPAGFDCNVSGLLQCLVLVHGVKSHRCRRLDLGVDQRYRVGPSAVLAAGREAKRLEAINQVGHCFFFPRPTRGPAFEFIRSEGFDDLGNLCGINLRGIRIGSGDRHPGNEQCTNKGQLIRHR